jgi:hypothetical protein
MAATEEDIMVMAELVRPVSPKSFRNFFMYKSFKRAYLVQGPTIPKVQKALLWIG